MKQNKTLQQVFEKIWSDTEAYNSDVSKKFYKQWVKYSDGKI